MTKESWELVIGQAHDLPPRPAVNRPNTAAACPDSILYNMGWELDGVELVCVKDGKGVVSVAVVEDDGTPADIEQRVAMEDGSWKVDLVATASIGGPMPPPDLCGEDQG